MIIVIFFFDSRYNPCCAVRNCNFTDDVALCQTRKRGPDYGTSYVVGQHDSAYFDGSTSPFNGIDIIYPLIREDENTTRRLESIVHVMCERESVDTFEYEPGSETSSGGDRVPQSAHFFLNTRLACVPQTIPVWLIVVLSIMGLGAFCVCASMIACCSLKQSMRSLQEDQVSGLGEGGLNSARISPAIHRASNSESDALEPPSGPEVHLPQNSRWHNSQALLKMHIGVASSLRHALVRFGRRQNCSSHRHTRQSSD